MQNTDLTATLMEGGGGTWGRKVAVLYQPVSLWGVAAIGRPALGMEGPGPVWGGVMEAEIEPEGDLQPRGGK